MPVDRLSRLFDRVRGKECEGKGGEGKRGRLLGGEMEEYMEWRRGKKEGRKAHDER